MNLRLSGRSLDVKDLGKLKDFLGDSLKREENCIKLFLSLYTSKIIECFGTLDANTAQTPVSTVMIATCSAEELADQYRCQEIIGCLMYLATHTRPDISFAVNLLSRKCNKTVTSDMIAAKRILHNLFGTKKFSLVFSPGRKDLEPGLMVIEQETRPRGIQLRSPCCR